MKARFLALAALVLGLASCQNDFEAGNAVAGGEVDFQLSVSAPELVGTRAGDAADAPQNALNSAFGAIDYFQGGTAGDALRRDWSDVNLRYTLEVYDAVDLDAGETYEGATPVKDRQVIIVDEYQPVTFELRLVPKRDYHFVVFADFVPQEVTNTTQSTAIALQENLGISHTIGNTLADIKLINHGINDERTDAYFAAKDFTLDNSVSTDIVLKRPYGKLRVIATDLHELNLNVNPAAVKVEYTAPHLTNFNAVTGKATVDTNNTKRVFDSEYNEIYKEADKGGLQNHFYTTGYDALEGHKHTNANGDVRHTHMTLFTDYILADDLDQPQTVHFTMTVYDEYDINAEDGRAIKSTTFNTDIPVQRNYLTTVIGNVLTTATEVEVTINDNFADENGEPQLHTILETLMNGGEFTLTEDLEINVPTTLNGDAIINLNGHTLTYTIPADCEDNTSYMIMTRVADGSSLTFVGDGDVVSDGYIASANKGGKVYVNGGNYSGDTCTLFQANGGKVYISGGVFKAAEYDGDHRYTLNHVDSQKNVGKIEVTGGKFYKYNPAESASENPVMNFAENCAVFHNGDWFEVYYVGANLTIDAVVESTDELKDALEDANVKVVALKAGTYDLDDKIYYLANAKTLVSYNTEKALVKGKIVANTDFSAYNIAFASNLQTTNSLSTSTYGSKVNGTYASIITLNKAAGTFEGCEFSDYPQAAINYFVETNGKELHVNKCKFTGEKAIYSKVLCEVTNCEFITNNGVPVYVWPRVNDDGFVTVKDNAMGLSLCQLGFLTQTGAYDNLTVDVQGNTGEFTYIFAWSNAVQFNMSGITFAPGSKTFSK